MGSLASKVRVSLRVRVKGAGRGDITWGVSRRGFFHELPRLKGFKYRRAGLKCWRSGEGVATAGLRKGETVFIFANHGSPFSRVFMCVEAVVKPNSELEAHAKAEDGPYGITIRATNLEEVY